MFLPTISKRVCCFCELGVETTRALSVVGTGQEIKRPWYAANSKEMMESGGSKRSRHPPNVMISEPGDLRFFSYFDGFHCDN